MKNADMIRAMDDEKLASFLAERIPEECGDCVACDVCCCEDDCIDAILRWLQNEE